MKQAGELNGATLGHVRAARRAYARGDRARARELAERVVKAWSVADDEPPALAEMRRLLVKLGAAPAAAPP
jgi:eukaryotic-like serine/threonine-protein kinase